MEIKLSAQCLHAVKKVGQATAGNPFFSFKSNIKNYWSARHSCFLAVHPILGIICHMLIRLQPIKFLFLFVNSLM